MAIPKLSYLPKGEIFDGVGIFIVMTDKACQSVSVVYV